MPVLLQINSTLNWGSTGRIAENIGVLAKAQGWSSYIAHGPRFKNDSQLHTVQISNSFEERIHGIWYSLIWDKHGLGSRSATRKFIKKVDLIQPDIIHLHNIHGYYLNYSILFDYFKQINIPIVWTLHDCWPFTGHCSHFVQQGCEKWQTGCFNCNQLLSYPKSLGYDNSRSNWNLKKDLFSALGDRLTFITVSEWLASMARKSYLKNQVIDVIYNGIDINIFYPRLTDRLSKKYDLRNRFVILGVASAWSNSKGLLDFIKLRKLLPVDQYVIVLIGLSKQQILGLPEGIIGIERTQSMSDLADFYSLADVVLSLSLAETFGLTIAEGYACGTPAIVYDCTAPPELITDGTGYKIPPRDMQQLLNAIEMVRKKGKNFYTKACRNFAEECFNQQKCFQQYIDLYDKLLNK